jgi:hypothetical protein
MYADATLPFPRGTTYKDDGNLVLSDNTTCGAGVVGRLFETTDSSGRPLVLRAVRADAALTNIGFQTVSYTAGKIGMNVDALCNADGEVASIVDDAYPATYDIAQYDVFYVVEEGFVKVLAESDVSAAGVKVEADAGNNSVQAATADHYVIGVATEAVSATATGYATIHVLGGLKPGDPAS